ncbi:hypothetical protein PVAND_011004 [Polypedilum vanderplanki]|uniref:Uncharacterized protein n=1 Tax=Polypedilum vanderplanki TaxID=319348 RepID=A0A9J6CHT7_POLVA|nr:hypothetical protein PVAND_011004 [Polypedilum vanderplanki]
MCPNIENIFEIVKKEVDISILQEYDWIDDILDGGLIRRQLASHILYEIPMTVACSQYINFKILKKVLILNHPDDMKINIETGIIGFKRQAIDIIWSKNSKCSNDYENLFRSEEVAGVEHFADDLTEGKFTFPTIYAIDVLKDQDVYNIVIQRPKDIETRRKCVKILQENGTKNYCLNVIKEFYTKLLEKTEKIGQNAFVKKTLDFFMNFDYLK